MMRNEISGPCLFDLIVNPRFALCPHSYNYSLLFPSCLSQYWSTAERRGEEYKTAAVATTKFAAALPAETSQIIAAAEQKNQKHQKPSMSSSPGAVPGEEYEYEFPLLRQDYGMER
jgi:hypothetical protein